MMNRSAREFSTLSPFFFSCTGFLFSLFAPRSAAVLASLIRVCLAKAKLIRPVFVHITLLAYSPGYFDQRLLRGRM